MFLTLFLPLSGDFSLPYRFK